MPGQAPRAERHSPTIAKLQILAVTALKKFTRESLVVVEASPPRIDGPERIPSGHSSLKKALSTPPDGDES